MRVSALAVATCLAGLPMGVQAAGLGQITVLSSLGQPLRAEVEVSAAKEELAGMSAQLASSNAFRQAGIDYSSMLGSLRFALVPGKTGKTVIHVTSDRPINDPFVDMLVELTWPSGRLVREYTFLLDPPEMAVHGAAASPATVEARPVPGVKGGTDMQALGARGAASPETAKEAPSKDAAGKAKPTKQARVKAETPAKASGAEATEQQAAGSHVVKSGETLHGIASQSRYDGVSLEQMLVGLYRANSDAFIGGNMHRLRTGAILKIPEQSAVAAIPQTEAKQAFNAQANDWNNYRRKLAASAEKAPASEQASAQSSTGRIVAKVDDKATPPEPTKDQVRVSRTESGKSGKAGAEDTAAREKALREAQERVAQLEKNVGDLQKLVEMKNQNLSELQKQLESKSAVKPVTPPVPMAPPVPPRVAATPVVPPVAVPPPVPAKPAAAKPETPLPASEAKPAEELPVEAPASTAKPEAAPEPAPKPEQKPAPQPVEPAPAPEEPGFFDGLLDNALPLLGGLGGVLVLGLGYVFYKRRKGLSSPPPSSIGSTKPLVSLGPNSVFRGAGGQSVDTSNGTPLTTDFSQAGPGTIDTDEVDPVAEADVYMAYGRDAQAEEILLEALQKDPQRTAIHAKLLEIYANRQSTKQFETLASELYAQTGGTGPEWTKAAALGAQLDPGNPLYGQADAGKAFSAEQTLIVPSAAHLASAAIKLPEAAVPAAAKPAAEALASLDFDLGSVGTATIPLPSIEQPAQAAPSEIGSIAASLAEPPQAAPAVDFDLDLATTGVGAESVIDLDATPLPHDDEVAAAEPLDFDAAFVSPPAAAVKPVPAKSNDAKVASLASTYVGGEALAATVVGAESVLGQPSGNLIDFELDMGDAARAPSASAQAPAAPSAPAAPAITAASAPTEALADVDPDALEFDVKLTESTVLGSPMVSGFDMSSISLDLDHGDAKDPAPAANGVPAGGDVPHGPHWEEVNTKLDLAKAYEEMGDHEGARELLTEVLGEGEGEQLETARAMVARLDG